MPPWRLLGTAGSGMRHPTQNNSLLSVAIAIAKLIAIMSVCGSSAGAKASVAGISSSGELPSGTLSSFGRSIKTVVISVVLGTGPSEGVCDGNNSDWRTGLPRYLVRTLSPNAKVLVFDEYRSSRVIGFENDCRYCEGIPTSLGKASFSCREWFRESKVSHADMLLVLGSGRESVDPRSAPRMNVSDLGPFAHVQNSLRQPWVGQKTRLVHMPVSYRLQSFPNGSQVSTFHSVISDSDILKPVQIENLWSFRRRCKKAKRTNTLLYVARATKTKGQKRFLQKVDPELLRGFRLDFRSSQPIDKSFSSRLEGLGRIGSINMVVHQKPLERADLLSEMCKAKGLVHYARADANPRVVYESIVAGLPVFVSEQSNIPQKLQQQPFVHVTPWEPIRTRSIRKLNKDFSKFMKYISSVNQKKLQATIDKFISSELTEEASYNGICIKMGICEETREGAAATGFYSACLVGLVTASAVVIFVVCRSAGVGPRTERSRVPGYL